jgi:hypothetical protein
VSAVKRIVVSLRPHLRQNFGRTYKSSGARPTSFGFVGQRVIANFTPLGADSHQALSAQVDRAKARLWDLEQLQKGILRDEFGGPMQQVSFELMACPLPTQSNVRKSMLSPLHVREAAETLNLEARKFDIGWQLFREPREMAQSILLREAA